MARGFTPSGDYKSSWHTAKAGFSANASSLSILGNPVVEKWEDSYMGELSMVAASRGGRILEIGFGLGLSASHIRKYDNVTEHVIIEFNQEVFKELEKFAEAAGHAGSKVTPKLGDWKNIVPKFEDGSFDGILYDTYPLSEAERDTHQFAFISKNNAYRILKKGGIITYCNLTSFGNLKKDYEDNHEGNLRLFNETQRFHLIEAGFDNENIQIHTTSVNPPESCKYYQYQTALVPRIIK